MKYFTNIETLEDLKKAYRTLAMKHHPDRGGDLETMKEINSEYDSLFKRFGHVHKNKDGQTYEKRTEETAEEFKDLIDKLIRMQGITVEIIGSFVWISGDTKPHKEGLKALGFIWHSQKKCWYKKPAGYRRKTKKNYSMAEIRDMYGVQGTYEGAGERDIVA